MGLFLIYHHAPSVSQSKTHSLSPSECRLWGHRSLMRIIPLLYWLFMNRPGLVRRRANRSPCRITWQDIRADGMRLPGCHSGDFKLISRK